MQSKVLSIIRYLILVAVLVLFVFQKQILADGIIGKVVQGLAFVLMIWARRTFGRRSFHAAADPTEGSLVTAGPYKYFRHSIYAALLYFIWSTVFTHFTWINLLAGICAIIGAFIRIFMEEKLLREKYPEYEEYAQNTKRIIPFVY